MLAAMDGVDATSGRPHTGRGPGRAAATARALRRWRDPVAQFAALVAVAVALLWPAPLRPTDLPGMFGGSDLLLSHWPNALLIQDTFARTGRLPLWNPHYGGGRPLAADPLAALGYPPTHLVHFFTLRDYFLVSLIGHLLLAGAGTLLLARRALWLAPPAALVAAVAFMATPRLLAHLGAGHLTMIQTVAWFPWVALACRWAVRAPARGAVPLAGALALLLLAGHPQLAYYGALLTGALALWLLPARWRAAGGRGLLGSVLGLGAAGALAVLLAAVHLLPLAEFTAHSTRRLAVATTDAAAPGQFVLALLGFRLSWAVPWEARFDPGLAVLLLAALGVAARPRIGVPLALGVALVAGLALGHGAQVYPLAARLLPGFGQFRGVGRVWFVALLALALLAGLGAEELLARLRRASGTAAAAAGALAPPLLAASLLWTAGVGAPWGLAQVGDAQALLTPSALERAAAAAAGDGRIYGVQRNMRQLSAVRLGAELADGRDPLLIEPYVTFMQRAGGYEIAGYRVAVPPFEVYDPGYPTSREAQPDAGLLGLLDVRVVLSRTPLTDPRLVPIDRVGETAVYRNLAAAGPAFLVAPGPDGGPPPPDALRRLEATVEPVERGPERTALAVTSATGGLLVLASPAFPGWVARLDGRPVALETIGGVLAAVRVPPGAHQLTYTYAPDTVRAGGALSLGGVLIALLWLAGERVVARRRAGRPGRGPL